MHHPSDQPNPQLVWETMLAHQRTYALKAGIEFGVFDALGAGPQTAAALATRAGLAERPVRILCDYLTVIGLIAKQGNAYQHTPTSAVFLDKHSPASMAPSLPFIMSEKLLLGGRLLLETIRRNHTALPEPIAGEEVEEWVTFARTMQPVTGGAAGFIANTLTANAAKLNKVLDVASSHGMFGLAIAKAVPSCEIVALDFPTVLEVTKENAAAAGVAITPLPGSAFTAELGTGYDAILVTNLLHHFNQEDCITLLKRFHAALAPGGRVAILEFVPNEDRVSPPVPASFALGMLANTPAGDAYTFAEYEQMLDAAGFGARSIVNVPMSPQQLIVATA